jgi:hypothetical protein
MKWMAVPTEGWMVAIITSFDNMTDDCPQTNTHLFVHKEVKESI